MPDKRKAENKGYILYKNNKKIGEYKSIRKAAAAIGCTGQNIQQNKVLSNVYKWSDYILTRSFTWEAEALIEYQRLAPYISNPATAYKVFNGLRELLKQLEGDKI